ncbi:murein DD-endopeptidase MepM/ murein hydrolase activator NlpD [Desulfofundulus luciae]|uniref:Murein DD-endopeptidase MepM/ murein hydrolase activator NlpD n=1 Tax=Desulfofundulus luciae TaxID=74702 RepID=A0ABU0AZH1_9FIRM|nr:M23 family metallopeptidase [Desulfofundulus luciae]MDQ0285051.1 murein DD-endopeptidase MepM/ murein hydrolase activator NlpD [Desulfofundulus luciae]
MWPFGKRLSGQDPVEKYRRWLRRWLLGNWLRYAVVSTVVVALVMVLIWAMLSTWQPTGPVPVPAPGKDRGVQLMHSQPSKTTQPVDGKELVRDDSGRFKIYAPVDGRMVQAYGMGYSEVYGDFRFNQAVAFGAGAGALVKAAAPGTVRAVQPGAAVGQFGEKNVTETSGSPVPLSYTVTIDHGYGWQTVYRGLGEVQVKAGQHLSARAPLGTLSRSGKVLEFTLLKDGAARNPAGYLVENIHR